MNYEEMSDFEINKLVAARLGLKLMGDGSFFRTHPGYSESAIRTDGNRVVYNYCNNPSDAWPIILEFGISLDCQNSYWEASIDFYSESGAHGIDEVFSRFHSNENPLRAAMIVYLMMGDEK